jgi:predicted transcriptional regulator
LRVGERYEPCDYTGGGEKSFVTGRHIGDLVSTTDFWVVDGRRCYGYTFGMKTAVSIPDDIFKGAERLARRTKRSRSRLFSDAIREYLARHSPDEITEAMNKACAEIGDSSDPFSAEAARRVLEQVEW